MPTQKKQPPKSTKQSVPKQQQQEQHSQFSFGEFIRQNRVKAGFATQAALAKALGRPQSFVAQMETGKTTHLDYREKLDLAKALESARVNRFKIDAALLKDKDHYPAVVANLLTLDVLDLDGLAAWEIAIQPQVLWIAAPNFVDNEHEKMLDAVVHNLQAGTEIVYFVAKADCQAFGRFTMLARKLRVKLRLPPSELEKKIKLKHYELEDNELCWLASSFVIANPGKVLGDTQTTKEAEGYIILNQDTGDGPTLGESLLSIPAAGFKMSQKELELRALGIWTYINNRKEASQGSERRLESIEGRKVTG